MTCDLKTLAFGWSMIILAIVFVNAIIFWGKNKKEKEESLKRMHEMMDDLKGEDFYDYPTRN